MRENAALGLARNAFQERNDDEQTREVANIRQLVTPTETSSGFHGNPSSGADRELQRGRTWDRGTRGDEVFQNTHDLVHDPSTPASRGRECTTTDEPCVYISRTDRVSCGGESRAGSDESRPLAQAQQDNVQGIEDKSNYKVVYGGDACWDQASATRNRNACLFASDTSEEAPPSPLPSAPVPLSPTARQGSFFLRRLPPKRVASASASLILPQNENISRMRGSSISKPKPICDDESSTLGVGNEAVEMKETNAQHGDSNKDNIVPLSGHRFFKNRAWDPVVGATGDTCIQGADHVLSQEADYPPHPCRRRRNSSLPETVLRDIKGQANDHSSPQTLHQGEANKASSASPCAWPEPTRTSFCDRPKVSRATAPGAQMSHSVLGAVGTLDTEQPPLHEGGLDTSIPVPCRYTADEAEPRADRSRRRQRQHPKTAAAVLILQRWLRRVILSSKPKPLGADLAAQCIRGIPAGKGFKGLQSMDISPSVAVHYSSASLVAPQSKDRVQASSGGSPSTGGYATTGHPLLRRPTVSRRLMYSDIEAGSLVPEMETLLREEHPALSEHERPHALAVRALDRSHRFPRRRAYSVNDVEVTQRGSDFVGTALVRCSRDFGDNGDLSRHSRNIKRAAGAGRVSVVRRTSNPRQDSNSRSPHDFGLTTLGRITGVDKAPKLGPAVSFSLPSSPPLRFSASLACLTPALSRVRLLEAGRRNSNQTSGSSGCSRDQTPVRNRPGWFRVEGMYASPSPGCHQDQPERQVAVESAAPMNGGVARSESRFEIDTGYRSTVLEAYPLLDRRCPSRGSRVTHRGPGLHASQSKSCCPDAEGLPVLLPIPRSHQQHGPGAVVPGAISRHHIAVTDRGVASNPLLHAWGVCNPLLTTAAVVARGSGTRYGIASSQGVAPHS